MIYVSQRAEDLLTQIDSTLYSVSVPRMAVVSYEEVEEFGIPYTGHESSDRGYMTEVIPRRIRIPELVEIARKGHPIRFSLRSDPERIYNLIKELLAEWVPYIQASIHQPPRPIDWFMALDEFAGIIYASGKHVYSAYSQQPAVHPALAGHRGAGHLFKSEALEPVAPAEQAPYESITDLLIKRSAEDYSRGYTNRGW